MTRTPRADFWFSILLTAFGAVVTFESWRMPRLENLGIDPMSAPGLTPGLLGMVLTGLGLALFARGVRAAPDAEPVGAEAGWGRFAVTLALCLGYALILLGRVPFWMATAVFVAAFILAFTWREPPAWRTGLIGVALALVVAVAVTLLFERVFLVRLP